KLQSASPAAAVQQQSILQSPSRISGRAAAPGSPQLTAPLDNQWDIASRPAVKILARREGWHRVTQPQLLAAGLEPAANPQMLQLFADGLELPILVTGQNRSRLDPSDAIEFFATPLDTPSTDVHTYYLVTGSSAGRRIRYSQGNDGERGAAQSFPFTVERKERSIYFAALKNGDADNFFGPVVSSDPVSQSLTVRNLAPIASTNASLEITLQGATDEPGSPADHAVRVQLNGSDVGTIIFDGQSRKTTAFSVSSGLLREGDNAVTLTALGGEMDLSLIDIIKLTYSHTYAADDGVLRFTAQGLEAVKVTGFASPQIRVLDVTDLNDIQELKAVAEPQASGFAVSVTPQDAGQRTLLAFADSQINQPAGTVANQPSRWNRAGQLGDLILISHGSFIDAALPLQTARERQGLKVAVVNIEDLYDEFSYGARSPQAIKDFLARAKATWKKAPRFVLLAGDASFDPRNYLGFGDSDFVPTKLVETDFLETASDDWFVDFNSDSLPDMAIGRLPARTAGDAAAMVTKIIGYDTAPKSESLLLVADRNDTFNFEAADDELRSLIPKNVKVNEIRRGRTDDMTAKNLLIEMINQGQKIVNYTGHGSVEIWRGNLLTSADAAQLTNTEQLTLFVTMT
ncbi:MAG TPA: C25 family cysteine peptidase, partial [Blastocatellia bacterium]